MFCEDITHSWCVRNALVQYCSHTIATPQRFFFTSLSARVLQRQVSRRHKKLNEWSRRSLQTGSHKHYVWLSENRRHAWFRLLISWPSCRNQRQGWMWNVRSTGYRCPPLTFPGTLHLWRFCRWWLRQLFGLASFFPALVHICLLFLL